MIALEAKGLQTLVVGLGNPEHGDDGVGIHIVNELRNKPLPPDVWLMEGTYDTRDIFSRMMSSQRIVIIDSARMGLSPGSVKTFLIDGVDMPQVDDLPFEMPIAEMVKMKTFLDKLPPALIIGVEPKHTDDSSSLSGEVLQNMPTIVKRVYDAILDFAKEVVN